MASALACSDFSYEDLAKLLDVFYIGGTKNGGFIGEALVLVNKSLQTDFSYAVKHYGALLAKGFVCGAIFEVLMNGDFYLNIGKHENDCAHILSSKLKELGVNFLTESVTNQVFPIFNDEFLTKLEKHCSYEIIEKIDSYNTCIRFVTGFETTKEECYEFVDLIKVLLGK